MQEAGPGFTLFLSVVRIFVLVDYQNQKLGSSSRLISIFYSSYSSRIEALVVLVDVLDSRNYVLLPCFFELVTI